MSNPDHDCLSRPIFHALSKRSHRLGFVAPMIGLIGEKSHGASALRYFATGFDDTPSAPAPRRRDSEPRSGTHWSY
jgi:hypothetical protein